MDTTGSRMQPTRADIGGTIRAERARAKLTMDQLAEQSDLSKSTVLRIENGQRTATTDQLLKLAQVFGLRVSEIWAAAESAAQRRASLEQPPRELFHAEMDERGVPKSVKPSQKRRSGGARSSHGA